MSEIPDPPVANEELLSEIRARAERLSEIRAAVEPWADYGNEGTYKADVVDYGKIDIAILRDVRYLLSLLPAAAPVELQGEPSEAGIEAAALAMSNVRPLTQQINLTAMARAAITAYLGAAPQGYGELEITEYLAREHDYFHSIELTEYGRGGKDAIDSVIRQLPALADPIPTPQEDRE